MIRTVAAGIGLAFTLLATRAGAEQPPPLPPASSSTAPTSPSSTVAARPTGTVRLSLRSYKNKEAARLFVEHPNGAYAFVCQSPCKADVVPGTNLRVTLGDSEEPHDFQMSGNPGTDVDLEVRPASKGALAGGIVMVSLGGATAIVGLLLLAVAALPRIDDDSGLRTAGFICLGAGGGLTFGGIALIAGRSREPRIRQDEHGGDKTSASASRAEVFRGDLVTLRPALPTSPALTPLTWGLNF